MTTGGAAAPDIAEPSASLQQRPNPRARLRRRHWAFLSLVTVLVSTLFLLALVPDHILFRDRLAFSILELDREREIQPLDHQTYDGLTLRSWYVAPQEDRPTIVYFPGRDGDIINKPAHLVEQVDKGYGLVLVGYRGFGGNPGFPTEMDMYRDVNALLHHAEEQGLMANGIVLYGYSMGSVFAANAAVAMEPLAVVLEAPLSNFLDAVRQQAGHIPAFLVRTRLDNLARLPQIKAPILLLAGGRDTVTPPAFAYALANANPMRARVELVPEAGHFSIIRLGGRDKVRDFLTSVEQALQDEAAATQALVEEGQG